MAYDNCLENSRTEMFRGFKSYLLRHIKINKGKNALDRTTQPPLIQSERSWNGSSLLNGEDKA